MFNIKECFVSGKFFAWKPDFTLKSKFGQVLLSLAQKSDSCLASLILKKISGTGKFVIKTDWYSQTYTVSSFQEETFIFILPSGSKIEIYRPKDGIGEISILGIQLLNSFSIEEKDILNPLNNIALSKENSILSHDSLIFKSLFKKFVNYSGIKLTNGKLYASSGATIQDNSLLESIESQPPNCFIKNEFGWKALQSCQILKLNLKNINSNFPLIKTIPLQHRENFSPILSSSSSLKDSLNENKTSVAKKIFNPEHSLIIDFSKIISSNKKLARHVFSNGQSFFLLKKGGEININCSALQKNTKYILNIFAKRINGNGKCKLVLIDDNTSIVNQEMIFNHITGCMNIHFHTNESVNHKMTLSLSEHGLGEVLFSSIFFESISDNSSNEIIIENNSIDNKSFKDKRFVIVIPSYNNAKWCKNNIESVLNQNYPNYRVIYTDDCSTDDTFEKVNSIIESSGKKDKFILIKNEKRLGALCNLHAMISSCQNDEIILTLDGDDWLANDRVLDKLNEVYSQENVWMTYGEYQNYPDKGLGIAKQIPDAIIKNNKFREYAWCATHLRTFYAFLFKNIKINDLKYSGQFMTMTWDMAIMFPMLEMAAEKSRFIKDILYIYNLDNPINDHKVNVKLQQSLDKYVRGLPKYSKIDYPDLIDQNNQNLSVGLLIVATGKYYQYIQNLLSSADNHFLKGINVTYYLFSEKKRKVSSQSRKIVQLHVEHQPFPFASMNRFAHFTKHSASFIGEKYLYYIDVDSLFAGPIGSEILGDLVGVQHCGFLNETGPFENDSKSNFYLNELEIAKTKYFGGGFSGGETSKYLALSKWCAEKIEDDLLKGHTPRVHDESALNKYFADNPPKIVLTPSYHYPQGGIDRYRKMWGRDFEQKIILLDKDHKKMRV